MLCYVLLLLLSPKHIWQAETVFCLFYVLFTHTHHYIENTHRCISAATGCVKKVTPRKLLKAYDGDPICYKHSSNRIFPRYPFRPNNKQIHTTTETQQSQHSEYSSDPLNHTLNKWSISNKHICSVTHRNSKYSNRMYNSWMKRKGNRDIIGAEKKALGHWLPCCPCSSSLKITV